jgi:hypothetical protein
VVTSDCDGSLSMSLAVSWQGGSDHGRISIARSSSGGRLNFLAKSREEPGLPEGGLAGLEDGWGFARMVGCGSVCAARADADVRARRPQKRPVRDVIRRAVRRKAACESMCDAPRTAVKRDRLTSRMGR